MLNLDTGAVEEPQVLTKVSVAPAASQQPRISRRSLFIISFALAIASFVIAYLYFKESIGYDRFSCLIWLSAMAVLFVVAYKSDTLAPSAMGAGGARDWLKMFMLLNGLTLFYFVFRHMNYNTAPWNANGFFDDAAWDVYYMREHVESRFPSIQLITYERFILGNVRELLYAWYLLLFFNVLGYNGLILNFALVVLGYATVFFTALTAKRIFKSYRAAALAGALLTVNPFNFAHTFMGHRYAMTPPLMMASMYYITCAKQDKSARKALVGGIFAALCAGSGKTGKVYAYGLALAAFIYIMDGIWGAFKGKTAAGLKKPFKTVLANEAKRNFYLPLWVAGGFLIGFTPSFAFMSAFPTIYNSRESGLVKEFFEQFGKEGVQFVTSKLKNLLDGVLSPLGPGKQYTVGYPLISLWHAGLVGVGVVAAFKRKRYDVFIMSVLPVATFMVVPIYDYRLFISTPVWSLAVIYCISALWKNYGGVKRAAAVGLSFFMLAGGIYTGVRYLDKTTKNPSSMYLNKHADIGTMRMVQDVMLGVSPPSAQIKKDEFKRSGVPSQLEGNYFIAPEYAFGVAALYLMDMPKESIHHIASDNFYCYSSPEDIMSYAKSHLEEFTDYSKDLYIILQEREKIEPLRTVIENASQYGESKTYTDRLVDVDVSIYVMVVPKENIEAFKNAVISQI